MRSPLNKNLLPSVGLDFAILVAVLLFCGLSAQSFFRQPKPSAPPTAVRPLNRTVASIDHQGPAPERSTKIIELGCLGKAKTTRVFTTEASLLRLMAQHCGGLKDLTAHNESTKEALLIMQQGKKLTTPYFPLKKGNNRIVIDWLGNKGQAFKEVIEIQRKPREG